VCVCEHDAELLGIAKYVHFVGARDNIADFYRNSQIFLLTSREDPFPLVSMEAMGYGIPVDRFCRSYRSEHSVGTLRSCGSLPRHGHDGSRDYKIFTRYQTVVPRQVSWPPNTFWRIIRGKNAPRNFCKRSIQFTPPRKHKWPLR